MAGRRRGTPNRAGRPREVFLSHSSRDLRFTRRLATILNDHGIPTWHSEENINAEQWHDEIGEALGRCDWFLLVLTPAATRSRWVKDELLYAMRDARYHGHLVPLLVRDCDPNALSWTLLNRQMVDFTGSFEDGCRTLLRRWGLGYRA